MGGRGRRASTSLRPLRAPACECFRVYEPKLFAHTLGDRHRGNTTRLSAANHAAFGVTFFEQILSQLSGLACTEEQAWKATSENRFNLMRELYRAARCLH